MSVCDMQGNSIIYAPVVIPTCNRYEHFKECVESLSRCTYADRTELYISIDFPPNEKYVDGWEKIKEYVKNIGQEFEAIHLFFQEENLGPQQNYKFLRETVFKKHDRYIFSEDDNVFAPAFLDYMNRMLQLFEHDSNVWAVSGFSYVKHNFKSPIYMCPESLPWGMGYWKKKVAEFTRLNYSKLLEDFVNKPGKMFRLYLDNKWVFCVCVGRMISGNNEYGWADSLETLCNYFLNRYIIYPRKTLVLNKGFDGSGENCVKNIIPNMDKLVLDDAAVFIYDIDKKRIPLTKKRIFPLPEWVQRQAKIKNDPLTYILYLTMGRERYFRWKSKKLSK